MKAKTVKEGLVAAKWILENRGWCQWHYWVNKDGKELMENETHPTFSERLGGCCLSGALELVEYEPNVDNLTCDTVYQQVKAYDSIPDYNDKEGRTKEEVLALLDKLIKEQP